jgi:hypothetical protein
VLSAPYMGANEELLDAQAAAGSAASADLARKQTHIPGGDLIIRNARLFDPRDLSVTSGMTVQIRTGHIVRVAPDAELTIPAGAEVVDAAGRFLMPGLWDNHQHLGNDTDRFLKRVARFDAGTELGPHVFRAGIIDGPGPFAAPTRMLAASAAEALEDVAWYADHGYGQIKIYSSVDPALVPIIADAAHARGLRVSGHVPAFMSARQFVASGADEIQHLNFIVLNFLFDSVKDTRGMTRFTAVAARARLRLGPARGEGIYRISAAASHRARSDPELFRGVVLWRSHGSDSWPGRDNTPPAAASPPAHAVGRSCCSKR